MAESLAIAEKSLTKQSLPLENKEFLKTLTAIEWLLKNDFEISICRQMNNDYISIIVAAEDQYPYLINGLFHSNTCTSNGIDTLFLDCNGWANTLKTHIEKNNEFTKTN